jgi:hypothetical protein
MMRQCMQLEKPLRAPEMRAAMSSARNDTNFRQIDFPTVGQKQES